MPEDPLEQRVAAVERALGETPTTQAPTDHDDLRKRLADVEDDVAELEAAVQAVRGYVGGVKHVNDDVEQRADAALAKAEALEHAFEADRRDTTDRRGTNDPGDATDSSAGTDHGNSAGCSDAGSPRAQRTTTGDARARGKNRERPPGGSRERPQGRGGDRDGCPGSGEERAPDRCSHCGAVAGTVASRVNGGTGDRSNATDGPAVGEAPGAGVSDASPTPGCVGKRTLGEGAEDREGFFASLREVL
jgi:hypothetical protein